ncbi:hypothetical protein D9M71_721800 [compost metagenome]
MAAHQCNRLGIKHLARREQGDQLAGPAPVTGTAGGEKAIIRTVPVNRFGHGAGEAVEQIAFDQLDHRRQVLGDARRLEGGQRHQVVRFDQALDRLQVAAQIDHRPDQRFGPGAHRHPPDRQAVPPEGQGMAGFVEGGATRTAVHDLNLRGRRLHLRSAPSLGLV